MKSYLTPGTPSPAEFQRQNQLLIWNKISRRSPVATLKLPDISRPSNGSVSLSLSSDDDNIIGIDIEIIF
jgi:hypothetical protein